MTGATSVWDTISFHDLEMFRWRRRGISGCITTSSRYIQLRHWELRPRKEMCQTRWLIQCFLRYPKAKGHRLLRPERQRSASSCRSSPRRFLQHLEAIQRPGPLRRSSIHRRIPCYGLGYPEVGISVLISVAITKC